MREVSTASIERKVTRQGVFYPVRGSFASPRTDQILTAAEREFDRLKDMRGSARRYMVLLARYVGAEVGFHIQFESQGQHFEGTILKEHNRGL